MSLFDFIRDIKERGTPQESMRIKVTELQKLLTDLSFQDSKLSRNLLIEMIEVKHKEIKEIERLCDPDDTIRIYGVKIVEIKVKHAVRICGEIINRVVIYGEKFNTGMYLDTFGQWSTRL